MKRLVSLLLAVSMMILLVSCGSQTAEKYCTNCGSGMAKSDSFCPECGAAVVAPVTSTSANDADETTTATTTTTTTDSATTTTVTQGKPSTAKPTTTTAKVSATTTVKPTTAHTATKPTTHTTTAHKHTYSKYVCTGCGRIDKAHAYEWLVELVKENGTATGTFFRFDIFGNESAILSYDVTDDVLCITSSTVNDYGEFIFCCLDLKSFVYWYSRGSEGTSGYREVYGNLDAKNFSDNYPLTDVHYTGNANDRYIILEGARWSIITLLESLNCICEQSEGLDLTMADLGFSSWK